MSVGAWALLVFGFFAFVSAVDARIRVIPMVLNRVFNVIGAILGLFVASYTGVLLSVSNQPVWSDTWVLGGLFLASGLSGATAVIAFLVRNRPEGSFSLGRLHQADGYFGVLELALIIVFFVTVGAAGTLGRLLLTLPLWALAIAGVAASLVAARGHMRVRAGGGGATVAGIHVDTIVVSVLVLIGVLALRAAVIFSAQ
jgi:formate-dependent nitrite reductase membrane component NrfD